MKKPFAALVSVLICLSAGGIGSIFTSPSIPTWYAGLKKPAFNPPNWIFGPVWTTLFILMGISAYLIWEKGWKKKAVKEALYVFAAQLILNMLWSVFFFGMHSPALAFIGIIFLWAAILMTILKFVKISKPAAYLLTPYILWVSFAALLNLMIVLLNR
jgi:translocator protein